MVKRINFLEKGKYILTYKRMLQYGALWVLACLFIFVLLMGYDWFTAKRIEKAKIFMEQLNAKKKRTEALVEASKFAHTGPSVKEISGIYSNFPAWSNILQDIANSMPRLTWLTSFTTNFAAEGSLYRKVDIEGQTRNTSAVASFIENLNNSPYFKNVVLTRSARGKEGAKQDYSFLVTGEIKFKEKEWN